MIRIDAMARCRRDGRHSLVDYRRGGEQPVACPRRARAV